MNTLLTIKDLEVGYKQKNVLTNVNLTIHENDFMGIIGPNGGGKTTLLKAILGLIPINSGEIIYSAQMPHRGGDIGYLSQINQFDKKFPITVREVVLAGLIGNKQSHLFYTKKEKEKANFILEELGILKLSGKAIGELSGGQMQRVFLGRAIISNPKLLILDEPETYVDNHFESELYEKLNILNENMAILLVSHDVGTISSHVKSIACVNETLHYHPSNKISKEQLASYNCPIQIITHGEVPHTILGNHHHKH